MLALHNQSVFDFLLMHTGSIAGAVAFAQANNISITDDLVVGRWYDIPEGIATDADILEYYTKNEFTPATGNAVVVIETDFGIGEMAIAQTFIIR